MVIYNHKLQRGVKDMKKLICLLMVLVSLCGCVPQAKESQAVDESLLLDANVMTQYIPGAVLMKSSLEEPEFGYLYFVFMCNFDKDQPDFCYYSPIPVDENEYLHIDIETSKKIVWQVFGDQWDILENKESHIKNDETTVYHPTAVGWGVWGYRAADGYIWSEFNSDKTQVHTHFELLGPDYDADDIATKSYGNYKIVYNIVSEDGQTFIRFDHFEKE